MRWLALGALFAGCSFGVNGVDVEMGTPLDGDVGDANVEMAPPVDANLFDFASSNPFDLHRKVPDGSMPRKTGYPCSLAAECDNGFCIDGFCCDDLCDPFDPANQCRACNVPGAEGHCVFAQDGTDPRGLCDSQAASTCGRDGFCDGRGGCRLWGSGTVCGASACTSGTYTAPPMCDGQGQCVASGVTANCSPYECFSTACGTSCTASSGCVTGHACSGFGECDGKAGLGATCNSAGVCASGFCSQGVCCSTDCSGLCRNCASPGAKGVCLLAADGTDALDQCGAQSRTTCGQDGSCDGKGACRKWSTLTTCAPASCSGSISTPQRFCDGSGNCAAATPADCAPHACDPTTGQCVP